MSRNFLFRFVKHEEAMSRNAASSLFDIFQACSGTNSSIVTGSSTAVNFFSLVNGEKHSFLVERTSNLDFFSCQIGTVTSLY